MGYGWDEAIECDEIEEQLDIPRWKDQRGNYHNIDLMDTRHIKNILRRISQGRFNAKWLENYGSYWRDIFINELEHRDV